MCGYGPDDGYYKLGGWSLTIELMITLAFYYFTFAFFYWIFKIYYGEYLLAYEDDCE
jgi:hypothetical protein